jgi:hypothetical protein
LNKIKDSELKAKVTRILNDKDIRSAIIVTKGGIVSINYGKINTIFNAVKNGSFNINHIADSSSDRKKGINLFSMAERGDACDAAEYLSDDLPVNDKICVFDKNKLVDTWTGHADSDNDSDESHEEIVDSGDNDSGDDIESESQSE